jgi:chromosome segregation ATPase
LTQKCNDLEQRLRSNADQTTITIENTTERIQQNHQQQQYQLTPTTTTNPSIKTFQGELDRALNQLKQKRAEVHQKEIDIDRLNKLVDELEQEKRELVAELEEKSSKLNQMLTLEENFQQLETDLFNKQNQIEEYQNMIQSLQEKNQDVDNHQLLMLNQKYHQVDAQLAELKVMLAKKDSELSRTKEMYVEVCEQKNNLQDTLKLQFDAEYEAKLKDKVENVISNRLEEQKIFLNAEFNRKLDANLGTYLL